MEIPSIPGCENVVLLGPVSSGKTWLSKHWLASAPIVSERSVTIDTAAQFMEPEYFHSWGNPKALAEYLKEHPYYYRCVYHPAGDNLEEEFNWISNCIWVMDQPRYFIIEECHEYAGIYKTHPMMKTMIRYSRHRDRLGLICTSQRASEVSTSLTDACRMAVIFNTDQAVNQEAICRRFGPITVEDINNLRPCIYNDVTQEVEQHPQCIVWLRGRGFKVYDLGDKIKTGDNNEAWQQQQDNSSDHEEEAIAVPVQKPTEALSSAPPSGNPEQK